jgi:nicotinamide mononucleotide transporter
MSIIINWISNNYIELFGAITGIIYVFLEIRQNLWLWPVGIATSAVYIYVFFTGKLYADMSLQVYYLIISILGWYWWVKGSGHRAQGAGPKADNGNDDDINGLPSLEGQGVGFQDSESLIVTRVSRKISILLTATFILLFITMWLILDHLTDSPVPGWDAFITSLSIIATWMLARKYIEHWYLWMLVNAVAMVLFLSRGLYPTMALYTVYFTMSFFGLKEWKKSLHHPSAP